MFSLRTLFLIVAIAAFFAWSLVTQTYWVASAFVGLTVIVLLWSVLERKKPFWEACAVFGIGYLGAVSIFDGLWQAMPTQALLDVWLHDDEDPYGISTLETAKSAAVHCAFALLLGSLAGSSTIGENEQNRNE
jgi:hypothetical protein